MNKQNDNENNLTVNKINDKFFWDIYGRPTNAAGFLKDFLPSSIFNALDLSTLRLKPCHKKQEIF